MSISTRSRFILISVSITFLALLLFTSVMYDRAIIYKHQQEVRANWLLADQFYSSISGIDDINTIKESILDNITSEFQPAEIFAIVDKQRNVIFHYVKHEKKENNLNNLLTKIKKDSSLNEGHSRENNTAYSWFIRDLVTNSNKNYSLLIIYPLSSSVMSDVLKFFGLPFFISGFLLCWVMVWASIILSSLVTKLENQKHILSEQASEIEKARDEALHANSAKSNFLANMSHEIRTPLTSIIGFAESSLDIDQSMKERSKATKTIIKSSKHLLHIINEILDLSKIESGKFEVENNPVYLLDVLDEIKSFVCKSAEDKNIAFSVNYIYPLPEKIMSDQLRLTQILLNLCSNAIKFTERGHVYLNVMFKQESSILTFEVIDSGIGMSAEQLDKAFKPFEQADTTITRKFGGTGLGLTLSKQLTEMLNGDIYVESTLSKGSRFIVELKIIEAENSRYLYDDDLKQAPAKMRTAKIVTPMLNGKVLLVEDNKDIQDLIKLLLKKVDITIDVAENGKLAIQNAIENDYDLIFMDIQMPVMDGLTAMKELKQLAYEKPVIAMTANVMQKDRDDCKVAGFSGFISKPINRNELYLILIQYLKPSKKFEREKKLLTSDLLNDDPDLIDLIDKFMMRLPIMRDAINLAHSDNNREELSGLIHQMKGVGGGYGYPTLTELCAKVEFQIASQNSENTNALIEELNSLVNEILEGKDENHKIAEQAQL